MRVLLLASLGLSGCGVSLSSQQPPPKWTTGFWFWQGSSADAKWRGAPLDVLFVHAGSIRKESIPYLVRTLPPEKLWSVNASLPESLPAAREYWLVFRHEQQGVPILPMAPKLARQASLLIFEARRRGINIAGVQLDIDSPTGALPVYAEFLREVRKGLPNGWKISITALLDWFRPSTDIAKVIAEVDEFVPQFYDIGDRESYRGGAAIAARIDAARWAPAFNRFRKPYRVGISTFGRSRIVPRGDSPESYGGFGDLAPIEIATRPAFQMEATRNPANELLLNYRATRKTQVSYRDFAQGDAVQFILATPEAVRAAMESARRFQGYCAGVLFFRWPGARETLAMQPEEVLAAAGLAAESAKRDRVHIVNGRCAAVQCVDLYLESADPLSPAPVRYRIQSSAGMEYFLPEAAIPAHLTGPRQIEVSLPPYCGRGRLRIGRAVSLSPVEFTVEIEP